jgi:serine/threonine protein kinase
VYAKIGDFGLANRCVMDMWEILPTWQWLAPEIFNGEHYDERSDIYSFGMVLYEIFSGYLQFHLRFLSLSFFNYFLTYLQCFTFSILPYTDQSSFIVKLSVKLTDEQMENQELISQYEAQGYCIDTDSKEGKIVSFEYVLPFRLSD